MWQEGDYKINEGNILRYAAEAFRSLFYRLEDMARQCLQLGCYIGVRLDL